MGVPTTFGRDCSSRAGLYLNTSKTKVMKIIKVHVRNEQSNILVDSQDIKNVKNYVYLGAMITENYDNSKEIKRPICYHKNAMISLVKIWKDRAISITTNKRLLKSLVFSIATYGSECWLLKTTTKRKLTPLSCGAINAYYE